jgi:hypothetical protein
MIPEHQLFYDDSDGDNRPIRFRYDEHVDPAVSCFRPRDLTLYVCELPVIDFGSYGTIFATADSDRVLKVVDTDYSEWTSQTDVLSSLFDLSEFDVVKVHSVRLHAPATANAQLQMEMTKIIPLRRWLKNVAARYDTSVVATAVMRIADSLMKQAKALYEAGFGLIDVSQGNIGLHETNGAFRPVFIDIGSICPLRAADDADEYSEQNYTYSAPLTYSFTANMATRLFDDEKLRDFCHITSALKYMDGNEAVWYLSTNNPHLTRFKLACIGLQDIVTVSQVGKRKRAGDDNAVVTQLVVRVPAYRVCCNRTLSQTVYAIAVACAVLIWPLLHEGRALYGEYNALCFPSSLDTHEAVLTRARVAESLATARWDGAMSGVFADMLHPDSQQRCALLGLARPAPAYPSAQIVSHLRALKQDENLISAAEAQIVAEQLRDDAWTDDELQFGQFVICENILTLAQMLVARMRVPLDADAGITRLTYVLLAAMIVKRHALYAQVQKLCKTHYSFVSRTVLGTMNINGGTFPRKIKSELQQVLNVQKLISTYLKNT